MTCRGTATGSVRGPSTTSRPTPPRDGAQAHAASDFEVEQFLHLFLLNRGILLTPFHNMALMSPATTEADVDRHTEVFGEALAAAGGVTRRSLRVLGLR